MQYSERLNALMMGFSSDAPIAVRDDFGAAALIDRLGEEERSGGVLREEVQAALLTILLSEMIRRSDISKKLPKEPDELVREVQKYIRSHSSEQLFISEVAERFYVSKFYLTHKFTDQTGMSPRQFLNYTRLSNAYSFLHDPSCKIADISGRCGFASPSDMTRRFCEHYGMTPSEFRRRLFEKKQE